MWKTLQPQEQANKNVFGSSVAIMLAIGNSTCSATGPEGTAVRLRDAILTIIGFYRWLRDEGRYLNFWQWTCGILLPSGVWRACGALSGGNEVGAAHGLPASFAPNEIPYPKIGGRIHEGTR
jgi:hypothetical protein